MTATGQVLSRLDLLDRMSGDAYEGYNHLTLAFVLVGLAGALLVALPVGWRTRSAFTIQLAVVD